MNLYNNENIFPDEYFIYAKSKKDDTDKLKKKLFKKICEYFMHFDDIDDNDNAFINIYELYSFDPEIMQVELYKIIPSVKYLIKKFNNTLILSYSNDPEDKIVNPKLIFGKKVIYDLNSNTL